MEGGKGKGVERSEMINIMRRRTPFVRDWRVKQWA